MCQHLSAIYLVKNTKFIWHNINKSIHAHMQEEKL